MQYIPSCAPESALSITTAQQAVLYRIGGEAGSLKGEQKHRAFQREAGVPKGVFGIGKGERGKDRESGSKVYARAGAEKFDN